MRKNKKEKRKKEDKTLHGESLRVVCRWREEEAGRENNIKIKQKKKVTA